MSDEDRDELLDQAAGALKQSPDEDSDDDFESSSSKSGGKKKLLLILLPILLLGGGAGVYFSGILGKNEKDTARTGATTVKERPPRQSVYFDLPDMLVNLNSIGSRPSFLKLRASLELEEGADTLVLKILEPRIIDIFQVYMRELRLDDLRLNGGLSRLREELRSEINKAVSPVEVKQVFFRNMLVQ